MTQPQRLRLGEHRQHLQRWRVQARMATLRQEARAQELPYADCLARLLTAEVPAKADKPVTMRTVMARFPSRTPLESFDVGVQPAVDRKKVQQLATGRVIEQGDTVVFSGPPGTGKTHLSIALGLLAVQQRDRTPFTSTMRLLAALTKAYAETRLEERLKQDRLPQLLLIDDIGSMPIDQHGAHWFFHLISRRDERGAIGLTSNQSFGQCGEVFGNPLIATARLDRLWHHSVLITITGDAYRRRDNQKAGLLNNPEPSLGLSPRGGDCSSIVGGPCSVILDTRRRRARRTRADGEAARPHPAHAGHESPARSGEPGSLQGCSRHG